MSNISYCAIGIGPCLSVGEWISIWSGLVGAFGATLAAITFQAWREKRRSKFAISHMVGVARRMQLAIEPFLERPSQGKRAGTVFDQPGLSFDATALKAWDTIFEVRAAVRWALSRPEIDDEVLWSAVALLDSVFSRNEKLLRDAYSWREINRGVPNANETHFFALECERALHLIIDAGD